MIYFLTIALAIFWIFLLERLKPSKKTLEIEVVKSFLPQTSCTDCGYDSCAPYAESLLNGEKINLCSMGGARTFNMLRDFFAYPETIGVHNNAQSVKIIEEKCIGCTRCIKACPVDAIVGAPKLMHTVIDEVCNGCRLCLDVCPTDCIEIIERKIPTKPKADLNCIRCAKCNSPQNPNMEKVFYLVEAGDGANLAKLDLSLSENKEVLNSTCPVSIPLYDYLTYGVFLAEDAKKQEKFAQETLKWQNQKIARTNRKTQQVQQIIQQNIQPKTQQKPQNIIEAVNIYVPTKLQNTDANLKANTYINSKAKETEETEEAKKSMALSDNYGEKKSDATNSSDTQDIQAKLAALKNKVNSKDLNKIDKVNTKAFADQAIHNRKTNFVIARKVALDNLNYATKVLNNLKKAPDVKSERIKKQKILIDEAKKQLEAIEKEFEIEQN